MISTGRLILRSWESSDLNDLYRLCADPDVMRYFPNTQSRDASQIMLNRFQNDFMWHPEYGVWALQQKLTGEFIGMLGLQDCNLPFDFTPKTELVWRILPEFWSQGFAFEGALWAKNYALKRLKHPEVFAYTSYPNVSSQRLMQRLGMWPFLSFNHPILNSQHYLSRHIAYIAK